MPTPVIDLFAALRDSLAAADARLARAQLVGVLHRRASQLTWTNTSDPVSDIRDGIERARCTGPDQRLAPPPAWPLRFVLRPV